MSRHGGKGSGYHDALVRRLVSFRGYFSIGQHVFRGHGGRFRALLKANKSRYNGSATIRYILREKE